MKKVTNETSDKIWNVFSFIMKAVGILFGALVLYSASQGGFIAFIIAGYLIYTIIKN